MSLQRSNTFVLRVETNSRNVVVFLAYHSYDNHDKKDRFLYHQCLANSPRRSWQKNNLLLGQMYLISAMTFQPNTNYPDEDQWLIILSMMKTINVE
jgi:hypothetical protein